METEANGFIDLWLPRNETFTVTATIRALQRCNLNKIVSHLFSVDETIFKDNKEKAELVVTLCEKGLVMKRR